MVFKILMKSPFFSRYVYHLTLAVYNFFRYYSKFIKLTPMIDPQKYYDLYGFKVFTPYRLDEYFFANINTHFNCLIMQNYETSEKYLIQKYISKQDNILELGGCLGVISLIANKLISNKKNHVVLEIDKVKFETLLKNKKINNASFHILNGALSSNNLIYYNPSHNFFGGKISTINKKQIKIKAYDLDEIEKRFNLKFNTLIMDIEGGELEIFRELNFKNFGKIIFENHFTSKNHLDRNQEINSILKSKKFVFIEKHGKVEYWKKTD